MTQALEGGTDRFMRKARTAKQRSYSREFLADWERCEPWDDAVMRDLQPIPVTYRIEEEDVLDYNLACGETHPLMVDVDHAREHAPNGTLVVHPMLVTAIFFYTIGEQRQPGARGTWIRTPGARNPFQRVSYEVPLQVGDEISAVWQNLDRFIRRGKPYLTGYSELHDQHGTRKARAWATLILPEDREAIRRFATA